MKAPVICPKCNAPRAGDACPRCGLAASRMAGFTPRLKVNDALIVPWRRATEKWDDIAIHDELLSLAAEHDAFAWLAQQYSAREPDPIRERMLERVRKAAVAKLYAGASQVAGKRLPGPYRSTKTVLVLLVGVMVLGLMLTSLLAYVMPHPRDDAEATPTRHAAPEPTPVGPTYRMTIGGPGSSTTVQETPATPTAPTATPAAAPTAAPAAAPTAAPAAPTAAPGATPATAPTASSPTTGRSSVSAAAPPAPAVTK